MVADEFKSFVIKIFILIKLGVCSCVLTFFAGRKGDYCAVELHHWAS